MATRGNLSAKTVEQKRVIVWGQPDLLSWAVEFFLSAHKDWNVISLSNEFGIDGLFSEMESAHTDAVIIYQRACLKSAHLLAELLWSYPDMAVITVNPDNNSMDVYNKKQFCIHEASDFISVVEGELQLHPVQ